MPRLSSARPAPTEDVRYHHGNLRHALIAAALALLTEEQDWGFSLREVARRAGVSHNAPYNHFDSKQALLAAVAAAGYDTLRAQMQEAAAQAETASAALQAIGVAYVQFGVGNPAHYRLMFGTALAAGKDGLPSTLERSAAATREVLTGIVRQGAEEGRFAVSPTRPQEWEMAVLAAWALVHGLTVLLLDGLAGTATTPEQSPAQVAAPITRLLLDGLCTPHKS